MIHDPEAEGYEPWAFRDPPSPRPHWWIGALLGAIALAAVALFLLVDHAHAALPPQPSKGAQQFCSKLYSQLEAKHTTFTVSQQKWVENCEASFDSRDDGEML